jgi:hypothetical protein
MRAKQPVASAMFTVSNSPTTSPIRMYIDSPNSSQSSLSGVTSFAGWAIHDSELIKNVLISIDAVAYGSANYGISRQDVCAAFPNVSGCPAANVGWAFAIDTTLLSNGDHKVQVTATAADSTHRTVEATFSVSN